MGINKLLNKQENYEVLNKHNTPSWLRGLVEHLFDVSDLILILHGAVAGLCRAA